LTLKHQVGGKARLPQDAGLEQPRGVSCSSILQTIEGDIPNWTLQRRRIKFGRKRAVAADRGFVEQIAKSIPKPSILDQFEYLGRRAGQRRWRSHNGKRLYTWDSLHGEVEVFNAGGKHLGVVGPQTGEWIKPTVAGRSFDV
jgi:Cytotoxic